MNMFKNAPVVSGSTDKGKKKTADEVVTAKIEVFAALKTVIKSVEAEAAKVETSIKESIRARMIEVGCEKKARPENYKGVDGDSSASLQMRNRSSASALSSEERDVLDEFGIPYVKEVSVHETFIINPEYAGDMEMLSKISDALAGLNLPADFFMKQEEKVKYITNEESVEAVFQMDEDDAEILLPIVTTTSITPKLGKEVDAYAVVDKHMKEIAKEK